MSKVLRSSPTREYKFGEVQKTLHQREPALKMLLDVKTRWNSTFLMALRARYLKPDLAYWCSENKFEQLRLTEDEWKYIDQIIVIMLPFYKYTQSLSISRSSTVQIAWQVYNGLFQHLEDEIDDAMQAKEQGIPGSDRLIQALTLGKEKLSKYYAKTYDDQGIIYAVAATLNPISRFSVYSSENWSAVERREYKQTILRYYLDNYKEMEMNKDSLKRDTEEMYLEVSNIFR